MATFNITIPDTLLTAYDQARVLRNARDPGNPLPLANVANATILLKRLLKSQTMVEALQSEGVGFTLTPPQIEQL